MVDRKSSGMALSLLDTLLRKRSDDDQEMKIRRPSGSRIATPPASRPLTATAIFLNLPLPCIACCVALNHDDDDDDDDSVGVAGELLSSGGVLSIDQATRDKGRTVS